MTTPKTYAEKKELATLDRETCFELLATQAVGRLAVGEPFASPLVVPVNYVLDGEVIVFRSDLGSKITLLRGAAVSFEVDAIDPPRRAGWSVLVRGIAYEATGWETGHVQLESWATGHKPHWIRVVVREISGRELVLPDVDWRQNANYL